jgi:hypothetical protein
MIPNFFDGLITDISPLFHSNACDQGLRKMKTSFLVARMIWNG